MEKAEDSKDAISSREIQQAPPTDAFCSGSERGAKPTVHHKQDDVGTKPSLNIKSSSNTEASQREKLAESTLVVSINDRKDFSMSLTPFAVMEGESRSLEQIVILEEVGFVQVKGSFRPSVLKVEGGVQNSAKLPKPLPAKNVSTDNITVEENESEDSLEDYLDGEIEAPEEQELLDSHIKQFKHVRKRLREQHKQRIERYKLSAIANLQY
ncbi:hypothetical protein L7F22_054980 [Adiantum nelumboides]|nr:hypothetical protein [Adiantum nelumboides]